MTETTHVLHTAQLNNNCPECYDNNGLELTFTQIERENKFYSKASKDVEFVMHCNKCDTRIYPVSWTEDLERIFEYNRKLADPKPTGFKLKPLTYIFILIDVMIIAALIYFLK